MLHLDSDWIWDFWFADDGERFHVFYLKAPRSLNDPDLRHWHTTVGHATSADLTEWTVLTDALAPSVDPAFDDYTTWTGSVVRGDDGTWFMFYTGTSHAEDGRRQRIGHATSDDLTSWRKQGVVLESDPRWYEQMADNGWDGADHWRDPWVFRDPAGDGWHMLVTARANTGEFDDRGVVGHARSTDLRTWHAHPPLSQPGAGFAHLEVIQTEQVDGRTLLLFSCLPSEYSAARRSTNVRSGTWRLWSASPAGPFDIAAAEQITDTTLYVGKAVRDRQGAWRLIAFHNEAADGRFVGELSDPMDLRL
ncbi:MAG TPA: hypothetical protein VFD59_08660 [Nocardioidaceae bacterium]|nr:hypothetical protein [Nocardioidaceae bacterium]